MIDKIEANGHDSVMVRSPISCEAENRVCVHYYGLDLARGHIVNQGEAVGIVLLSQSVSLERS